MTIDALSIFFWVGGLWAFWMALENSHGANRWQARDLASGNFRYWVLTGLCVGFGLLSKYTNALQILSIVLVLASTERFRIEFRRPGFWAMIGLALACAVPPLIWNARHDWITVEHLLNRGNLDAPFQVRPGEPLVFLALHFGVYSPLIFLGMLVALYHGCREARTHFKSRFLVLFALPLIALYVLLSFNKAGQANWTAPAFVSLLILTVAWWHRAADGTEPFLWLKAARERVARFPATRARAAAGALWIFEPRRLAFAALALGLVLSLFAANTDAVRRFGIPFSYRKDPTYRLRGWKTVAMAVGDLRQRLEARDGKPLFLIGDRHQTASCLAFYLPKARVEAPGHPPVYIPESQAFESQFSFWPRYDEMEDVADLARTLLPKAADPARRDALAAALAAANDPKTAGTAEGAERRRTLIRAMLAVDATLPLDEYASQEATVSLFYGRDALFITADGSENPPTSILGAFEKIEPVAHWFETRRGHLLRPVRVFVCHNYHSLPL